MALGGSGTYNEGLLTRCNPASADRPETTNLGIYMRLCKLPQFGLRSMFAAIALLAVSMSYAAAYIRLSQRGIEEAATHGLEGFLYVPLDEVMASENLSVQRRWCIFFAPANWVDRHMFGGPDPVTDILFRISMRPLHGRHEYDPCLVASTLRGLGDSKYLPTQQLSRYFRWGNVGETYAYGLYTGHIAPQKNDSQRIAVSRYSLLSTRGGTRTHTSLRTLDFESEEWLSDPI